MSAPIEDKIIEPAKKYDITFYVTKDARHSNYIISGLLELEHQGLIGLQFKPAPYQSKNRVDINENGDINRSFRPYPWSPELKIKDNNSGKEIRIAVDLQDWDSMFSYHSLKNCNVIFKRAYSNNSKKISAQFKIPILPAGINHSAIVESNKYRIALKKQMWIHNNRYAMENPSELIRFLKEKLKRRNKNSIQSNISFSEPAVEYLKEPPQTPYVFFQVEYHNWNNRESDKINETRAKIIRILRKSLGDKFIGGMYFRKTTDAKYEDCLTNVPFQRDIYLRFVQQATVVICTNGFGDSVPWKLPEYLHLGKCIVAEPLAHELPLAFTEEEVLFFENVEQCPDLCRKLLQSNELRAKMEENAKQYYIKNIQPGNSILRMIRVSLESVGV